MQKLKELIKQSIARDLSGGMATGDDAPKVTVEQATSAVDEAFDALQSFLDNGKRAADALERIANTLEEKNK